ncbi:MAG TPA: D-aminoacylase, partial [Armatimonadota bacterium]|nr:D-aminoacylase [Armatimonadota bacterium]
KADIVVRGGMVIEGTGAPRRQADVAVTDGRIAAVGEVGEWEAEVVLEAAGLIVAPGFIDMHTHSDLALLLNPRAESKIRQGVTTEVIGQCGFSPAPAPPDRREVVRSMFGEWGELADWRWGEFGESLEVFRSQGASVNIVPVVGHGTIRSVVMGQEDRPPTQADMRRMREVVEQAMEEGAFGMSSGLYYAPGMFAGTDELVALASVMSESGGVYFSHIRGEGANLLASVREAIEIGRQAGVPVQISHLKAEGRQHWGRVGEALALIEEGRESGVEVGFDVYPYTAWNTSLAQMLPGWAREGGVEAIVGRLREAATRARISEEIAAEAAADPGRWERRIVAAARTEENRRLQGMTVADIAAERGTPPIETVLDILVEERLDAGMVGFGMCEEDVQQVLAHPLATIGSDSASQARYGILGEGHPHPRTYGTFARVLGHYAREERLFSLEEGVAKMTGRAAERLKLADRGRIAEGMAADVVVFDPDTIADTATYEKPHQYAAGVRWVIVNGVIEMEGEEHRGRLAGKVLARG